MDESAYPLRKIEEMVENHDSRRIPVKASDRKPGPFPYYGAQGIVDHVSDYIFDGEFVLVAEDGENLRSRNEPIAMMASGKFWVNNHAHILKGNGKSSTRFVYYAINNSDISGYVSGSTIPKLSQKSLNAILLPCPPIEEQRAIVGVLGALDDKIELNRRTNETLEATARALFKDWFVDFGPTRAKMQGCESYLAPELWDLFPDRLDDETSLPEGWQVFRLEQIAEQHTQTLAPVSFPDEEFEHFSIPAFDANQNPIIENGKSIKSNKTLVPDGAVLLSKLNPEISRVWLPEARVERRQISSTEFLAFTAQKGFSRSLLFCLFKENRFRDMLESMVTGTSKSHQRISPKSLLQREVLGAADNALTGFDQTVFVLLDQVQANRAEARTLSQIRDLLLPKLMSGEIRVRDAEKIVGEAL